MRFEPEVRAGDAFREPVTAAAVARMCRRVLADSAEPRSAIELCWGSYNSTFRVELADGSAVILRVAPRPELQLRSERHWLRSEYLAAPLLAGLGPMVPRVLGADFTHQVVGRDYLIETLLPGIPAPELMPGYSKDLWPGFFAQLGVISRRVHDVTGHWWGPLAGPCYSSWSEALHASLLERAGDLAHLSAPFEDVLRLGQIVASSGHRLDAIERPHLLHGDLWTANILLDPGAPKPTVIALLDSERASWGDPLADWSLYRADARSTQAERDAFWVGYGGRPQRSEEEWRRTVYKGWNLAAYRVEAVRNANSDTVLRTVEELAEVLGELD